MLVLGINYIDYRESVSLMEQSQSHVFPFMFDYRKAVQYCSFSQTHQEDKTTFVSFAAWHDFKFSAMTLWINTEHA